MRKLPMKKLLVSGVLALASLGAGAAAIAAGTVEHPPHKHGRPPSAATKSMPRSAPPATRFSSWPTAT
jgi:hypothetical protein